MNFLQQKKGTVPFSREWTRWAVVVLFAIGMAWVEAAAVYYIRALVDRIEPYQANPLPIHGILGPVELVREAATLLMVLTIGMLAGSTWHKRLGYTAIAFGVWDIFYYVFLRVITGWPTTLLDWDILFLLPLPWWGPVLAPVLIAALMIVWGTAASQSSGPTPAKAMTPAVLGLNCLGVAIALYVFMADAIGVVHEGIDATRQVVPVAFNWPLFLIALALMAVPAQPSWRDGITNLVVPRRLLKSAAPHARAGGQESL